jgi:hypothetical protein
MPTITIRELIGALNALSRPEEQIYVQVGDDLVPIKKVSWKQGECGAKIVLEKVQ